MIKKPLSLNWRNYGFCVNKYWKGAGFQAFLHFITLTKYISIHLNIHILLLYFEYLIKLHQNCLLFLASLPNPACPKWTSIPKKYSHLRSCEVYIDHISTDFPTEPTGNTHKPFYCLCEENCFPLDLSAQHSCLFWNNQILQLFFFCCTQFHVWQKYKLKYNPEFPNSCWNWWENVAEISVCELIQISI